MVTNTYVTEKYYEMFELMCSIIPKLSPKFELTLSESKKLY